MRSPDWDPNHRRRSDSEQSPRRWSHPAVFSRFSEKKIVLANLRWFNNASTQMGRRTEPSGFACVGEVLIPFGETDDAEIVDARGGWCAVLRAGPAEGGREG